MTARRAVVFAGEIDTPYLRAGKGEAIVLIARDIDAPEVVGMVERLAAHFLVIAAAPPAGVQVFESWLPAFLEGLGAPEPHVTIHASIGVAGVT